MLTIEKTNNEQTTNEQTFSDVLKSLIGLHNDIATKDNTLTIARRQGNDKGNKVKTTAFDSPFNSLLSRLENFAFRGYNSAELCTLIQSDKIQFDGTLLDNLAKSLVALMPNKDFKVSAQNANDYLTEMLKIRKTDKFIKGLKFDKHSAKLTDIAVLLTDAKAVYQKTVSEINSERKEMQDKFNAFWKNFSEDSMSKEMIDRKKTEQTKIDNYQAIDLVFVKAQTN